MINGQLAAFKNTTIRLRPIVGVINIDDNTHTHTHTHTQRSLG